MKWPESPEEMDSLLGFVGNRIPDGPATAVRNKVVWKVSADIKITYERHPYHAYAPDWHRGPPWHLDAPGLKHRRFLAGNDMPDFLFHDLPP